MSAPEVFDYLDYRVFLKDFVQWRRDSSRGTSLRQIASKVGIDHSLLTKIIQSTRHITPSSIPALCVWMKFDEQRASYFEELVAYARARSDEAVQRHFEKLLSLKPVEKRRLEAAHYEYFRSWHHVVVRSLLDWYEFYGDDWETLGAMLTPPISGRVAQESVELLEKLGLVEREPSGRYKPSTSHLSTGERWQSAAVRTFQREVIRLSEGAVERVPKELRDISTITVALSSDCLEEVREVLREARAKVVKIADRRATEDSDAVYQLNLQWFPVTRPAKSAENG